MKNLLLLAPALAVCALVATSCKMHSRRPDPTREEVVVTAPATPPPSSTPTPSATPR